MVATQMEGRARSRAPSAQRSQGTAKFSESELRCARRDARERRLFSRPASTRVAAPASGRRDSDSVLGLVCAPVCLLSGTARQHASERLREPSVRRVRRAARGRSRRVVPVVPKTETRRRVVAARHSRAYDFVLALHEKSDVSVEKKSRSHQARRGQNQPSSQFLSSSSACGSLWTSSLLPFARGAAGAHRRLHHLAHDRVHHPSPGRRRNPQTSDA